jgi:hypothetical protein
MMCPTSQSDSAATAADCNNHSSAGAPLCYDREGNVVAIPSLQLDHPWIVKQSLRFQGGACQCRHVYCL